PTQANPLIARLARLYDCNNHGNRTIRQPGNRFSLNFTHAIPPVRDAEGKVDVQGTMQAITDVVEGWVREHPEQWLWLHRRWRPEDQEPVNGQSCFWSTADLSVAAIFGRVHPPCKAGSWSRHPDKRFYRRVSIDR